MTHSGAMVWSGKGKIVTGGSKTYLTKNIKAGVDYLFVANGTCKQNKSGGKKGRSRGKKHQEQINDFGLNFKAYIGTLDPIPLDAEVGEVSRNKRPFRAVEDNPQIRVEDDTDSKVNVKCEITDVQVRIP
jgi:hypothetical protein